MSTEQIILFSIIGILAPTLIYYIVNYYRLRKKHKDLDNLNSSNAKNFKNYINRIQYQLENGSQLRKGFIEQSLVKDRGGQNEMTFNVIVEVREIERTVKRSKIEVIDFKIKGTNQRHINLQEISNFYNGWMNSNEIQWKQSVNGREELIDQILNEIEEDEKIKIN